MEIKSRPKPSPFRQSLYSVGDEVFNKLRKKNDFKSASEEVLEKAKEAYKEEVEKNFGPGKSQYDSLLIKAKEEGNLPLMIKEFQTNIENTLAGILEDENISVKEAVGKVKEEVFYNLWMSLVGGEFSKN